MKEKLPRFSGLFQMISDDDIFSRYQSKTQTNTRVQD